MIGHSPSQKSNRFLTAPSWRGPRRLRRFGAINDNFPHNPSSPGVEWPEVMEVLTVMKFGGSSLADTARILGAAARAAAASIRGEEVVVVVSAQGDTTDDMIALSRSVNVSPSPRELDAYLAAGEQMSACLMAMALESLGRKAVSLTGWQAGLQTDGEQGDARVTGLGSDRIRRELDRGRIVVAAGFQGLGPDGDVTTLGRGGSDTTAVALAAWLKADRCLIYTDVDGVYDRDPRTCPDAKKYDRIGYGEMLALARGGAQVLHDRCVELAQAYRVPLRVLSSFRGGEGTLVSD